MLNPDNCRICVNRAQAHLVAVLLAVLVMQILRARREAQVLEARSARPIASTVAKPGFDGRTQSSQVG